MAIWVCRADKCFWDNHLYKAGDTVDVTGDVKWDYSGGYWHPLGSKVIDAKTHSTIPRHFEPLDFSVLVSKDLVTMARKGKGPVRKFQFAHEIAVAEEEKEPKPLDPIELKAGRSTAPKKIAPGSRPKGKPAGPIKAEDL